MRFTDDHHAFRRSARAILAREVVPHVDEWEEAGIFPAHQVFKALGSAGLLGLEYDPAYGGEGADHSYTVILGEELGYMGCAGVAMAITVQTDMATPALHAFGSEELKQRYLAPAIKGEMVASIAVTEPDAGSDVASIRTRARLDGDEWVISGSKTFITNGTQADWLCLLVRTSDEGGHRGLSQILFPTSTPGFSVSRKLAKLGNRCSDTAELAFDEARVPVTNTIGEVGRGFHQQMQQFQNERLIAAYTATGAVERALELTADYLRKRNAFGAPLLAKQYLQFKMAEMAADLDYMRHYNYAAAEAYMAGEDATRYATIAKLKSGRLQREVADTCLQFHGGAGYMEETWVSRFYRDGRLLAIGGGADEVMLQVLARMDGLTA